MAKSEKWYAAMAARKGKGTNQFTKAKEMGLPVPPAHNRGKPGTFTGRRHTDESRKKISEGRIQFLKENPDKVPYKLNHSSNGRSYPEEYWKTILDSNDVNYEEQYQIGLYSLDFAIVDKKIDLEIDGDQHYLDPKIVASDIKRTKFLEDNGWTVIRIRWSTYKALTHKQEYVKTILNKIMDV